MEHVSIGSYLKDHEYIINMPPAVVAAIIERQRDQKTQVLIQTRWKPEQDPIHSGKIELPAGTMDEYEDVYDTLRREVQEETGLQVTRIVPEEKTSLHHQDDESVHAFRPFCCAQQVMGGQPWVVFVFRCEVMDGPLVPQLEEVRDVRWIDRDELNTLRQERPEDFFVIHLGILDYYFSNL